ncbi:calcium-binding protein, partial [Geitlerinema sp. CS-897]|nr:calcium-binding protein [Geitlerinema sp. CS-897]
RTEDGNDMMCGGAGNDLVLGNQGNDFVGGGEGDDTLFGGEGDDTLMGWDGDDVLSGDRGGDLLEGGDGRDRFVLSANSDGVTVVDFAIDADLLVLGEGLSFEELRLVDEGDDTGLDWNGQRLATLTGVRAIEVGIEQFQV